MKENQVTLLEGNGVEMLPALTKNISRGCTICIFHTHVAIQMPTNAKESLLKQIKSIGSGRDVFHIYNNVYDRDLHLDYYIDGTAYENKVGETDGHGRWFSWEL